MAQSSRSTKAGLSLYEFAALSIGGASRHCLPAGQVLVAMATTASDWHSQGRVGIVTAHCKSPPMESELLDGRQATVALEGGSRAVISLASPHWAKASPALPNPSVSCLIRRVDTGRRRSQASSPALTRMPVQNCDVDLSSAKGAVKEVRPGGRAAESRAFSLSAVSRGNGH